MAVKTVIYTDIEVRNRPSFFATPVAWAAANLTQSLVKEQGEIEPYRTGMIVVSSECSLSTVRELSHTASQGTISPLRFAGSSPSIVTGLSALEQGIRGPTLSFTMPPDHASRAILAMIHYWIRYSNIVSVVAIAHYKQGKHRHLLKGLIARSTNDEVRQQILQLCKND